LWDGKLLSAHLPQRYQVTPGVRQCQRIFRQPGFCLRKPRPQVAQSDRRWLQPLKKLRHRAGRKDIELWSLDECRCPPTRWP
jgi:hypothetical protein